MVGCGDCCWAVRQIRGGPDRHSGRSWFLAAALYTWGLGASGDAYQYYSAAVLSGTKSWKAFFFSSLDPASFISVDKPPLALWIIGLSVRVFGFNTWSLLLPQAAEAVAAVAVLYAAVRRTVGLPAALIAALVLTLTPITVAITRDDTPDPLLVLLLVLAGWAVLEATRTGKLTLLLGSAVLVGLGFNTKMLQAYLIVPALALTYLVAAPGKLVRRLGHLVAAGAVLAVASFWWTLIVDSVPASARPYIGGSSNNTVLDSAIGANGIGRLGNPGPATNGWATRAWDGCSTNSSAPKSRGCCRSQCWFWWRR
ncbi:glycosyltransferase family 39 protein [Fodinicola feengrottensis]|uniref:glycosyltransferase family 39 protein n=1 Tax=Fodinicola feengrottensis TaxID=435914 RepID=UPI0013D38D70|nr:glycosyltransferase family 39 protein [Fodinicola feengrottensis]